MCEGDGVLGWNMSSGGTATYPRHAQVSLESSGDFGSVYIGFTLAGIPWLGFGASGSSGAIEVWGN